MILKDVVKKIKPGKSLLGTADKVVSLICEKLEKKGIKASPVIGGSLAKGTNLKGDFDIDIFVRFHMSYKNKNLSDILEPILKIFKPARVHGSRDYFQFKYKGAHFEIVPVIDIKKSSRALNVTDVSPLHAIWVKKNIKNLSDHVRLAKRFCKAQGVYGAESYINGFSGYILEILVIHYGGFTKLLKAVSKWKPEQVIDTANYYSSKKQVFKKLNKSKLDSPLIVIDPVQKNRNAAAALNLETFSKFVLAARRYLQKPSNIFFDKSIFSITSLKEKSKSYDVDLILVKINPLNGKEDVVGSKILKVYNYFKKQFILSEFSIMDSGWNWNDKVHLWFLTYPKLLPKYKKHSGPLVYSSDFHVKKFLSKHKRTIVGESRIFAITKRIFRKPKDLAKNLIKEAYVKEKVKTIKLE
ncbi:MAG: CCA tRNA nucleotidyltransferase [Nanoarchaeota archaeon]|nr:CCA tRNA nucleotidyltransferase [Nanoarchaeota archaeon]